MPALLKADGNLILFTPDGGTEESYAKAAYKKHRIKDGILIMQFYTCGLELIGPVAISNLLIGAEVAPITDDAAARIAVNDLFPSPAGSGSSSPYTDAKQKFTGSTSATITLAHTYLTGRQNIDFFKNGILLDDIDDYIEASATTLTLIGARLADDKITVKYKY